MKPDKLTVSAVEFDSGVRVVAVVNADNKVLSHGAFNNKGDAETALHVVWTLLLRLGLTESAPTREHLADLEEVLQRFDEPEPKER